ncbi:MAG: PAS domain S-box protein [Phycisphaerae bacterium]
MKGAGKTAGLTIRQAILLVLIAVLIPAILVEGIVYHKWYETRMSVALNANLEMARAAAMVVRSLVSDIRRQEVAIGVSLLLLEPHTRQQLERFLKANVEHYKSIRAMSVADAEGRIVASSIPERIGTRIADRDYFKAIQSGEREWVVSDLIAERVTGELAFVVAVGIRDDGRLRYVVTDTVSPTRAVRILNVGGLTHEGIVIFDSRGVPVMSEPQIPLKLESFAPRDRSLREALAGREAVGDVVSPIDGQTRIGASIPIPEIGWVASASRTRRTAVEPVTHTFLVTLGLIVLVIIGSAAIALFISHRIVGGVRRLHEYAVAVGRGRSDCEPAVSGVAELVDLGEAFRETVHRRRQIEGELRASEERYRGLVELSSQAILVSRDDRIEFANPAALRLLGAADPAQILGRSPCEVFHPDCRAIVRDRLRMVHEGRPAPFIEEQVVRLDGALRDVEVAATVVVDRQGPAIQLILHDITDRKRAERLLRESQADLKRAQAVAHTGSWRLDVRRNELVWSDETYRIFGIPHGTRLTYETFMAAVLPEDRAYVDGKWKAALRGEPYDIEHRIVAEGRVKWVHETAELDFDAEGNLVGGFGTAQDITERKEAEEKLRKLSRAVEQSPAAVVITDTEGTIEYVNPQFTRSTGYTFDEAVGRNPRILRTEHTPPGTFEQLWRTLKAGGEWHGEFCNRKKNGELYWESASISPVTDGAGRVTHYVAVKIDITERKRAEAALRRSNERLEILSEMAARLLAAEEPQGIVNSLCEKVMAYLDCQVFLHFLVDEQAGRLHLNACAGIPAEVARKIEWVDFGEAVCGCVARDGSRVVVENIQETPDPRMDVVRSHGIRAYACHPLLAAGRVIGTLSFGTSTRTHFTADELAMMKAVADQVAIAMERQRAMETLRQTAADLARSNRDLEQFASVASHDLQEPLRTVAGYLQLLERRYKSRLDKEADEFIAFAVDGALRLKQLINDLLSYSRVGTRGRPFEAVDMNRVFADVVEGLGGVIRENGATVTSDPLPIVRGDPTQLSQLLQNLIANGIKFRRDDPPRVHVSAREVGTHWEFSVRDNGIGMAPEYFERVFVVFQRLHTQARYPGTGIGLAICKKIVDRHGGRIWVESEVGAGSTFFFTLPGGAA